MSDPSCSACSGTWPDSNHFIADLGLSMAYLHDDQFFPGWTVVVFKRHATELFHLAPTERIQMMEEVSRFANMLAETFDARKMNYGLLATRCRTYTGTSSRGFPTIPRRSSPSGAFHTTQSRSPKRPSKPPSRE